MSVEDKSKVRFAQRISKGFANGLAVGFVFYLLGSIATVIVTSLPVTAPEIGFAIGLGSSIAIELGKDQ